MDTINRQAIHDKVTARYPDSDATQYNIGYADAINDVLKDIRYMPSAESSQKTGKWITKSNITPYYTEWWYECSECCQKPLRDGYGQEALSDYCPYCGCRMVGEEDG